MLLSLSLMGFYRQAGFLLVCVCNCHVIVMEFSCKHGYFLPDSV